MPRAGVCESGAEAKQTRATLHNPEDSRGRGFHRRSPEPVGAGQGASRASYRATPEMESGGVLWSSHVHVMSLWRRLLRRDLRLLGCSILSLVVRPLERAHIDKTGRLHRLAHRPQ